MKISQYDSGLLHSNMYIVEENGHAIVIDPASDTTPAEGLTVDLILLTHEHYDHISGVNAWKEKTGAKVLCSAACAEQLENPRKNMARIFPVFCAIQTWCRLEEYPPADTEYRCSADETFTDEYRFSWQGHEIDYQETPGHSPGSSIITIDRRDVFTGDSLLRDMPTEVRLPGGSAAAWEKTGRPRINQLTNGQTIHPGHFESFKLRK